MRAVTFASLTLSLSHSCSRTLSITFFVLFLSFVFQQLLTFVHRHFGSPCASAALRVCGLHNCDKHTVVAPTLHRDVCRALFFSLLRLGTRLGFRLGLQRCTHCGNRPALEHRNTGLTWQVICEQHDLYALCSCIVHTLHANGFLSSVQSTLEWINRFLFFSAKHLFPKKPGPASLGWEGVCCKRTWERITWISLLKR